MQISSCLKPIHLKDIVYGGIRELPCGKCYGCRTSHGLHLADCIDRERKFYRYCYFFTLTYSDENLPLLFETDNFYVHPFDRTHSSRRDIQNYFIRKDSELFRDSSSRRIIDIHHLLLGGVPVLSHNDLTHFFKKLNNIVYAKRYYYKQSSVRYFAVGEYGPASYRPHYHGFLFFDSDVIEREVEELVNKAWTLRGSNSPLGFVVIRPDKGTATRYSSLYSTLSVRLPKYLSNIRWLAPFHVQSSRPAFGKIHVNGILQAQTFFGANPQVVESDSYFSNSDRLFTLLPRHLESKLFPKLPHFRKLFSHELLVCYSISFQYKSFDDFYSSLFQYFPSPLRRLFAFSEMDERDLLDETVKSKELLQRIWSCSRRFVRITQYYGIIFSHTLSIIERYYSNVELLKLRNFYELQVSLSDKDSLNFMGGNPDFLYRLYTSSPDRLPRSITDIPLTEFPLFVKYQTMINKTVQNSYSRKHANSSSMRSSNRVSIYQNCKL